MKIIYHLTLLIVFTFLFSACSVTPEQITLKKSKQKEFTIIKREFKLAVTATAYTSTRCQTDKTPFLAAWNNRLKPGVKSIAVSRDLLDMGLTNGTYVTINGLRGRYKVLDKMNKRWKKKIDIYMGTDLKKAKRWGKRKVTIRWEKKSIEPLKGDVKKRYTYTKKERRSLAIR